MTISGGGGGGGDDSSASGEMYILHSIFPQCKKISHIFCDFIDTSDFENGGNIEEHAELNSEAAVQINHKLQEQRRKNSSN